MRGGKRPHCAQFRIGLPLALLLSLYWSALSHHPFTETQNEAHTQSHISPAALFVSTLPASFILPSLPSHSTAPFFSDHSSFLYYFHHHAAGLANRAQILSRPPALRPPSWPFTTMLCPYCAL
jgi:hypothetical protein